MRKLFTMKLLAWLFLIGLVVAFIVSTFRTALNPEPDEGIQISRSIRSPPHWPAMGATVENLFWIVQVSDIHISAHRDLARGPDLHRFCKEYIKLIDPKLVIITGDLTDAKDETNIRSIQNINEWKTYHSIVHKCQDLTKAKWLDVRGNHDAFDVLSYDSENNHYKDHSVFDNKVSELDQNSYHYKLHLPFGNYSFIGFDASVVPGSNRPFNFFGYLNDKQIRRMKVLSGESQASNHTVWFGHFPTSLIVHEPPVLRSVMRHSIAYLCGHLHTLANAVTRLYTRQKTGQLELELGDWKDNRVFRVIAFDHDLMSFADARLGDWPLVIITNPKDSQFYTVGKEPVEMVQHSTHIRALVFNPDPIKSVSVKINGLDLGLMTHVQGPLYVKEWDPMEYSDSLHEIRITVKDNAKRHKIFKQYFSLNETLPEFELLPRFLLMVNIFSVGKVVFGIMVFSYTLILTSLRQCSNIRRFFIHGVPVLGSLFNSFLMKVWLVSQITSIYSVVIGCVIYLTFGPWFYGELVRGHGSVVFVWGLVFHNAFIPSGITYFYGIFQVLFFNLPLLFLLGHILDQKRRLGQAFRFMKVSLTYMASVILTVFWIYVTIQEFPTAYGSKALYFGPLRVSCVVLIPVTVWMAVKHDFKTPITVNGVH